MRRLIFLPLVAFALWSCEQMGPQPTSPDARLSVQEEAFDEAGDNVSVPTDVATPSASVELASPPPIAGCRPGNVQTLAVAAHSGGGQSASGFGPEEGNDGVYGPGGDTPWSCTSHTWIRTSVPYPTGAWYELEWASPQRICQIWVDTKAFPGECGRNPNRGLHGADVQTWDGSSWVTHGSVTNATDDWGFVIAACPTTTKLRLFNVGTVNPAFQIENPVLHELKVYDCSIIFVDIDIKPGGFPNSINCTNEKGVIPVAILSTPDFDALTVNHTTVEFQGASEIHLNKKTGLPRRHEEDVDGDGDMDLLFHFRYGETNLTCTSTEGTLRGETDSGIPIEGTDAVRMVGG